MLSKWESWKNNGYIYITSKFTGLDLRQSCARDVRWQRRWQRLPLRPSLNQSRSSGLLSGTDEPPEMCLYNGEKGTPLMGRKLSSEIQKSRRQRLCSDRRIRSRRCYGRRKRRRWVAGVGGPMFGKGLEIPFSEDEGSGSRRGDSLLGLSFSDNGFLMGELWKEKKNGGAGIHPNRSGLGPDKEERILDHCY
ncbi:hypothetical protein U1Q18_012439 [Sarracenia purpurea var. burkii]